MGLTIEAIHDNSGKFLGTREIFVPKDGIDCVCGGTFSTAYGCQNATGPGGSKECSKCHKRIPADLLFR